MSSYRIFRVFSLFKNACGCWADNEVISLWKKTCTSKGLLRFIAAENKKRAFLLFITVFFFLIKLRRPRACHVKFLYIRYYVHVFQISDVHETISYNLSYKPVDSYKNNPRHIIIRAFDVNLIIRKVESYRARLQLHSYRSNPDYSDSIILFLGWDLCMHRLFVIFTHYPVKRFSWMRHKYAGCLV